MNESVFQAARTLGAAHVAALAGLRVQGDRGGPCPGCGAVSASKKDPRRPPLKFRREGRFRCYACGADGSGLDFALLVVGRSTYDQETAAAVGELLGRPGVVLPPAAPERLPPLGAERFRALHARRVVDLGERGAPEAWSWLTLSFPWPAALTAYSAPVLSYPNHSVPSWLPLPKSRTHRALFALWGLDGSLAGARFRATKEGAEPKTWSPRGYTTTDQLLATEEGVAALRGGVRLTRDVVVVEGEKDLIAAATAWGFHADAPLVFGLVGHPGPDLCRRLFGLTRGRVWLWVDPDKAGDSYVRAFARAEPLPGGAVVPALERSKDVSDLAMAGELPIRWDSHGAAWASGRT